MIQALRAPNLFIHRRATPHVQNLDLGYGVLQVGSLGPRFVEHVIHDRQRRDQQVALRPSLVNQRQLRLPIGVTARTRGVGRNATAPRPGSTLNNSVNGGSGDLSGLSLAGLGVSGPAFLQRLREHKNVSQ